MKRKSRPSPSSERSSRSTPRLRLRSPGGVKSARLTGETLAGLRAAGLAGHFLGPPHEHVFQVSGWPELPVFPRTFCCLGCGKLGPLTRHHVWPSRHIGKLPASYRQHLHGHIVVLCQCCHRHADALQVEPGLEEHPLAWLTLFRLFLATRPFHLLAGPGWPALPDDAPRRHTRHQQRRDRLWSGPVPVTKESTTPSFAHLPEHAVAPESQSGGHLAPGSVLFVQVEQPLGG